MTGAADPTVSVEETLKGQASAEKTGAWSSSAATALTATRSDWLPVYVKEIYHPNYVAKRMEIGAVMGAAPRKACNP